jgi:hypothetical protein
LLRVDKNPRNQKSWQDEKEINSHPPIGKYVLQMKLGEFSAGVMKYHEQDSHAPNGIELRDFLAHSIVGRKGSAPLPREAESIVEGGLLPNIRNMPSITNREGTTEIRFANNPGNRGAILFQLSAVTAHFPGERREPNS